MIKRRRSIPPLNHFTNLYERFVVDETGSDVFSDCENIESDSESISEQCEEGHDDVLYSGAPITSNSRVVLLLSFVFKHKLTREAFSDLLAVVEAHCPRPNNCRTTVKKLFDFVSQAKGDIVKHYFCDYCNAYYGRVEDRSNVNKTCNIVSLQHPNKNMFDVVLLKDIIDVCVYMKFPNSDIGYAAHFPNHFEKD